MDSEFKQRFKDLEDKVDAVNNSNNAIRSRMDGLDGTLREMRKENAEAHAEIGLNITRETGKLRENVDARFNAVDARFNAVDTRFDRVEGDLAGLTTAMAGVVDILKRLAPNDE